LSCFGRYPEASKHGRKEGRRRAYLEVEQHGVVGLVGEGPQEGGEEHGLDQRRQVFGRFLDEHGQPVQAGEAGRDLGGDK